MGYNRTVSGIEQGLYFIPEVDHVSTLEMSTEVSKRPHPGCEQQNQ